MAGRSGYEGPPGCSMGKYGMPEYSDRYPYSLRAWANPVSWRFASVGLPYSLISVFSRSNHAPFIVLTCPFSVHFPLLSCINDK